ncbi:MAG: alpha-L-fucosidase [Clostridia bacterium]|nr:alpha-L-fucosidase [Clostridia bacterium]
MAQFKPTWESLKTHRVPDWFNNAKLGIMIHWGAYSVPAFAPPVGELGTIPDDEWFVANPYAEWYYNSVNVGRGPTYEHHLKTYGKDFPYENFTHMWKAEKWDPDEWAELFREAGAKYVVLVTKHHDGLCLFPSKYTDYSTVNRGPCRDITGELTKSVRDHDMRMGLYYSGIIDWTFRHDPMYNDDDVHALNCPTHAYADYCYNQYMELIDNYHPSVLWNDIGWPYAGEHMLPHVLSHYFNTCPDGVTNDRYNGLFYDYKNKEYEYHADSATRDEKWESTRGLGLSFGYNAEEDERHILSPRALVQELVKTVANNGNLLINVGPRADGTIPDIQKRSLLAMGQWLKKNGEAIYDTVISRRTIQEEETGSIAYARNGETLSAIADADDSCEMLIEGLNAAATMLEECDQITTEQKENGLLVRVSGKLEFPIVLKIPEGEKE